MLMHSNHNPPLLNTLRYIIIGNVWYIWYQGPLLLTDINSFRPTDAYIRQ